jgi:uncharacterized membrane protein YfcA
MQEISLYIVLPLLFSAALLYSSVGHAGASGYLAVMALLQVAPEQMRPAALTLNVLVATLATYKFLKAGAFDKRLFLIASAASVFKPVIGMVLVISAIKIWFDARQKRDYAVVPVKAPVLFISGGLLGFLSGVTGVGGGIFLSPMLLFFKWAQVRAISGISAAFILVNSVAGLAGVMRTNQTLPEHFYLWGIAVLAGGYIGSELGSRRLGNHLIRQILSVVLLVAGAKMIATA